MLRHLALAVDEVVLLVAAELNMCRQIGTLRFAERLPEFTHPFGYGSLVSFFSR